MSPWGEELWWWCMEEGGGAYLLWHKASIQVYLNKGCIFRVINIILFLILSEYHWDITSYTLDDWVQLKLI